MLGYGVLCLVLTGCIMRLRLRMDGKVHTFTADDSHPPDGTQILVVLDALALQLKEAGFQIKLIDLYWTVIPVMLVLYYASHPFARSNALRSVPVILLTWVWSLRLSHSYLRRERWELGAREDWRFSDLRNQYGKSW
ncbi:hypothetical protein ACLOJK_022904 [Asimina triloba]